MGIKAALNDVLVKLFRNINTIEEQAIRSGSFKDMTTNDMHVIYKIIILIIYLFACIVCFILSAFLT